MADHAPFVFNVDVGIVPGYERPMHTRPDPADPSKLVVAGLVPTRVVGNVTLEADQRPTVLVALAMAEANRKLVDVVTAQMQACGCAGCLRLLEQERSATQDFGPRNPR